MAGLANLGIYDDMIIVVHWVRTNNVETKWLWFIKIKTKSWCSRNTIVLQSFSLFAILIAITESKNSIVFVDSVIQIRIIIYNTLKALMPINFCVFGNLHLNRNVLMEDFPLHFLWTSKISIGWRESNLDISICIILYSAWWGWRFG
jgi:hypothetical protein